MVWQNVLKPAPHIIIGGGDLEPEGMSLTPAEAGLLVEQLNELLCKVYA